jgi:hypothetical protein
LVVASHRSLHPPGPAGSCNVSGRVFEGRVVRNNIEDFVANVAYNVLLVSKNGKHYVLPPELTEDEQLQVAVIVSAEEKWAFLGLEDALAISVASPPLHREGNHRRCHHANRLGWPRCAPRGMGPMA